MYRTCLHCTRDLGQNDVLETLPIGRRVAFDSAQGRLWIICRSCGKWNLVPFDTRLETIDDCERRFRATRTRYSTDNIGLARVPEGLELVRIGAPQRPEFASWRYGAQYRKRRRTNLTIASVGVAGTMVGGFALETLALQSLADGVALAMVGVYAPGFAWQALQARRLRVLAHIPGQRKATRIGATDAESTHVTFRDGEFAVSWCPNFIAAIRKRPLTVAGPGARQLVRRIAGLMNRNAGSHHDLDRAVNRLESGNIERWLSRLSRSSEEFQKAPTRVRLRHFGAQAAPGMMSSEMPLRHRGFEEESFLLSSISRPDRLAIEMWLSEEDEARALSGELALLERQWQEAEQLAAIADRLVLPGDAQ